METRGRVSFVASRNVETYGVTGSTLPTTVSPEILDQWFEWMVLAGYENRGCKFDGWGTEVP